MIVYYCIQLYNIKAAWAVDLELVYMVGPAGRVGAACVIYPYSPGVSGSGGRSVWSVGSVLSVGVFGVVGAIWERLGRC